MPQLVKFGMPQPSFGEDEYPDSHTPDDASRYELVRDRILEFFARRNVNRVLLMLAVMCGACIVFWVFVIAWAFLGLFLGVENSGHQMYPECIELAASFNQTLGALSIPKPPGAGWGWSRHAPIEVCSLNQLWFNRSVKAFAVLFSYVNFLPIPWRVAIFNHTWLSLRGSEAGMDFYGRPTNELWFNLPKTTRRRIAVLLNVAYIAHFASLTMQLVYQSYVEGQTWPGAFAQNLPFVVSVMCAVAGGVLQSNAEDKLLKERPDLYPPRFGDVVKAAWRKYRAQRSDQKRSRLGFLAVLRDELGAGGSGSRDILSASGLTGVSDAYRQPTQVELPDETGGEAASRGVHSQTGLQVV